MHLIPHKSHSNCAYPCQTKSQANSGAMSAEQFVQNRGTTFSTVSAPSLPFLCSTVTLLQKLPPDKLSAFSYNFNCWGCFKVAERFKIIAAVLVSGQPAGCGGYSHLEDPALPCKLARCPWASYSVNLAYISGLW